MKKIMLISLMICCLLLIPGVALGLNTAEVQEKGGEITLLFIGEQGLQMGVEYGLTPEIAAYVQIHEAATLVSAKYEFDSNLAIMLGVVNEAPFIGINTSMPLDENIKLMGDFSLSLANNRLSALLEMGIGFKFADNMDLRGGLLAEASNNGKTFNFQMGIGIHY